MSQLRNISSQSLGVPPDLSLSSIGSTSSSSPSRTNSPRPASTATQSTVPTSAGLLSSSQSKRPAISTDDTTLSFRKLSNLSYAGEEDDADVLDTPRREKRWPLDDDATTPHPTRTKSRQSVAASKSATNLTLRDQEKHIDHLKKENFNIKLKVHFLEERLAELAPDQIEAALKQNINLKIEVQQHRIDLKKQKKLILELEQELERLQRGDSRTRDLEERLAERERELKELRRLKGYGAESEDKIRHLELAVEERSLELRGFRRTAQEMRDLELELDDAREALRLKDRELLQKDVELDHVRQLLQDNNDEFDRIRNQAEGTPLRVEGRQDPGALQRKVEDLETEKDQWEDDRDILLDEIGILRGQVEGLERRQEAESIERSNSRAMLMDQEEEKAAFEEGLNAMRDKYAAAQIELQQREDDLEMKDREINDLVDEHGRILQQVEEDYRGEIVDLNQELDEVKTQLDHTRLELDQLEADTKEHNERLEEVLSKVEQDAEDKDIEIAAANGEIEKLGQQIYLLEEENEILKEGQLRIEDDVAAERERHDVLAATLRERLASYKEQLDEMTELYEQCKIELTDAIRGGDELAQHAETLLADLKGVQEQRDQLAREADVVDQEHDAEYRRQRRAIETKESALQSALDDLARTQSLLDQRNMEYQAARDLLHTLETESKRVGETHTTAKFSLQLEVDRLQRDLERMEVDLARARKDLEEKDSKGRDRDDVLDKLHAESRDLAAQLAAQTQARLNLSEKLDDTQSGFKAAETEIASLRARVQELEQKLSKDQRSLMSAEAQYRDQLTERNTLLLTIYQYMDKILGVDKTPKKHGQAETKPFTNFSVFHDNLITRLKALSQIQLDFDKRCKEAEARFTERFNDMRKQMDSRWRQLDKFEMSVKAIAEAKAAWRKKMSVKEGEIEGLKTSNSDLQLQLTSLGRVSGGGSLMEIRSLTARATNAERRLINLQNQLAASEEKMTSMNQKTQAADNKWEARVKEYESRLKAAEERVKRERQGAKERTMELETAVKTLERQNELSKKRIVQLNGVIEENGLTKTLPPPNIGIGR